MDDVTPTGDEVVETEEVVETPTPGEGEATPTGDEGGEPQELTAEELQTQLTDEQEKRRKAEGRLGYFEREAQRRLKEDEAKVTTEKPTETFTKPRPESKNFEDYDSFNEALVDWKIEQKEAARMATEKKTSQQEKAIQFQSKLDEGNAKYKDFDQVARNDDLPITVNMMEAMIDCEHPDDIAYYLGKNIPECRRIASLSPIAAAREIGKLEAQFAGPQQKTKSNAPEPTKTISGKETPPTKFDNMTEDDVAEYMEMANKKEFGV